ncbi:RNA-directed DNA polymerase from mobile element jockey [Elysia marginata]|uniref:RNA-directed DNA polymerase from mobile element jockey n=1 Tax=Elysia marginata TaxID=1093978 RepID=A0AAV4F9A0_9GAST|nr:RNA-directed DNA polymerase from mobile element jockey [Elysia marginata]
MRNAKIITLYKKKGDRRDCVYRGIFLLSTVGKAFARIVLNHLQQLADQVYPESQCGIRAKGSTIDMVFSIRQLQEKCREQRRPLYPASIDLTKAFDLVSWTGLFTLLPSIGCLPKLPRMIMLFHDNMMGTVKYDDSSSDLFPIKIGVMQGCVLALTLFRIFCPYSSATPSAGKKIAFSSPPEKMATYSTYRVSEQGERCIECSLEICSLQTMPPSPRTPTKPFSDSSHVFADTCREFSLTISLKKTNNIGQHVDTTPTITIDEQILEAVEKFTYLGSTIFNNLSMDAELNVRIGKSSTTMARLPKRLWDNTMLTLSTKMRVYQACVLSTLLYDSESWALH